MMTEPSEEKLREVQEEKCKYKLADGHFSTYLSITKRTGVVKINNIIGQYNQPTCMNRTLHSTRAEYIFFKFRPNFYKDRSCFQPYNKSN